MHCEHDVLRTIYFNRIYQTFQLVHNITELLKTSIVKNKQVYLNALLIGYT